MMLKVSHIDSHYGEAQVLRDVSFEVRAGEIVGLMGRNGAGKTTVIRTIMALIKPSARPVHWPPMTSPNKVPPMCRRGGGSSTT